MRIKSLVEEATNVAVAGMGAALASDSAEIGRAKKPKRCVQSESLTPGNARGILC